MANAPGRRPEAATTTKQKETGADLEALFEAYASTRDPRLREQLVTGHGRLVHYFALRLAGGGGATYDDLVQVGYIGLITAIDRFDPAHGTAFVTYAAPTIVGVIKRYLRDHTWVLKVPRRLRELGITLRGTCRELEATLGRAATIPEIALHTGIPEERIAEALELNGAYQPMSLDAHRDDSGSEASSGWEALGVRDPSLEAVDERETLRRAIANLDPRERAIIYGRFFGNASQSQMAARLGVSQMHVSRLERQALVRLREMLQ